MFNIHPHSRAHSRPTVIATGSVVNAGVQGDNVGPNPDRLPLAAAAKYEAFCEGGSFA